MKTPEASGKAQAAGGKEQGAGRPQADGARPRGFPAGTTAEDGVCWVCSGETIYRHCRIVCATCGFTRDCSDP